MSRFKAKNTKFDSGGTPLYLGNSVSDTNNQYWIYYCNTLFSF